MPILLADSATALLEDVMPTRLTPLVLFVAAVSGCSTHEPPPAELPVTHAETSPSPSASVLLTEPEQVSPQPRFVLERVEVRLAPSEHALATNTLDRQQSVEVFEVQDGWARVSQYYDGSVEGVPGQVARWVPTKSLAGERPKDLPQPKILDDPRVQYLPNVGDGGLSRRDVEILHAAARYFLEIGKARVIEYGDKSTSREGVYYVNFGGPKNYFFKPGDIPELESRIRRLYQ